MNNTQFVTTIAIILFIAFVLGWFASWLVSKFSRVTKSDVAELEDMAQALHDAEEARDQAAAYLQQREAELSGQVSQTEAELRAAMEGLREARHEASELRNYIEAHAKS
jgi:prophage endopeptidase